jgi:DNA-binding XRE family transcriptional regulator
MRHFMTIPKLLLLLFITLTTTVKIFAQRRSKSVFIDAAPLHIYSSGVSDFYDKGIGFSLSGFLPISKTGVISPSVSYDNFLYKPKGARTSDFFQIKVGYAYFLDSLLQNFTNNKDASMYVIGDAGITIKSGDIISNERTAFAYALGMGAHYKIFKSVYLNLAGKWVTLHEPSPQKDGSWLEIKFGIDRIRAVLAEKNITNRELSTQLGKAETTVSCWCTNDMQPSIETLYDIAKALDVDIRELLVSTK